MVNCLLAAAVVVDYNDVLFFSFCFCLLLLLLFVCLYMFLFFLLLNLSCLDSLLVQHISNMLNLYTFNLLHVIIFSVH